MNRNLSLSRIIIPAIFAVALTGCQTTFMGIEFGAEDNEQEGGVIDNPFAFEESLANQKPNKSELEVAALPQDPMVTDMTMGMMPDENSIPEEIVEQPKKQRPVTPMIRVPRNSYQPKYTHKGLNDYAEQMAMDLMARAKNLDTQSKIGIASFVDLTRNLQTTTVLGNQLSESFMNELQAYGISVIDFKTLDEIFVGQEGDLIFDRSGPRGDMQYVLSGTLQRSGRGVQVNARIIHLQDNVVVSSAKGFIPHFVVSSLTPDYVLMQ